MIAERHDVEARLHDEKERAQVTLHSIGDAVITTDASGIVQYLNPMAEQLTGWSSAEAAGKPVGCVFDVIHDPERTSVEGSVARCLREGSIVALGNQTTLISREGHEYSFQDTAAPIRSRHGILTGVVLVFSDVTESRRLAREATHHAAHDSLTGLVNRREFETRLRQMLDSVRANDGEHVLCYLDLDQFKIINDTCGHPAGDALLCELATALKLKTRSRDTLARLGGDEFGILMEHCTLEQGRRVAELLRNTVAEFQFFWQDKSFKVGASIGLVAINASSKNMAEVLRLADAACYTAKDEGRNRVHVYQEHDVSLVKRQGEMQWVSRINDALEDDRFCLYAQTIKTQSLTKPTEMKYELLLRMEDEAGRIIPPGAFMPAAERYDLATNIDQWVVDAALRWLARNPKQLARFDHCAINLSGRSVGSDEFLKFVMHQFVETAIPPEKICFEITETAAITNVASATRFIAALKEIGCQFALDDFGSGLSSFAYLKNFPVDFLKIDGAFVKAIVDDPIDLAMVKSINEIGHVMGTKTIAEFVENDAILKKLSEIGVDYVQGYGIGKPHRLDDICDDRVYPVHSPVAS